MNTNTMDARIKELMAMGATFAEAHKAALDEALAFGKGKGWAAMLFFFPFIVTLILGFGSAEYLGNPEENKTLV